MKNLVQNVKQWGVNKGLHKVGHLAQAKYTLKEVAELLDAYADKDLPAVNDAIGDILVTLIVGASNNDAIYHSLENYLNNDHFSYKWVAIDESFYVEFLSLTKSAFSLEASSIDGTVNDYDYNQTIIDLDTILDVINRDFNQSLSLKNCLQLAYNEIKDRKGRTDENGHFIKEN